MKFVTKLSPNSHRARRASSSRKQACLPPNPTSRPEYDFHDKGDYIWKGSAETLNMQQEMIKLDVYWLPETDQYLYTIRFLGRCRNNEDNIEPFLWRPNSSC